MKNILKIAAAAGIMLSGSAALAQSGNGSDVTGPSVGSTVGGIFSPLPSNGGNAPAPSPSAAPAVAGTGARFTSGAAVTSPITGAVIPAASVAAVGSLITGGSSASIATVGAGLTSAGASPAAVANLTSALAALANVTSASAPAAILNAAKAYNALIASVPASFFTSNNGGPPSMILAVEAALAPMVASLGH